MDKIVDAIIALVLVVLVVSALVAILIVGTPVLLVTGVLMMTDKVYGCCKKIKGRSSRDMRE